MRKIRFIVLVLVVVVIYFTNNLDSVYLLLFVWAILYLLSEIYKFLVKSRALNNPKLLPKIIYGEENENRLALFNKESIQELKGLKRFLALLTLIIFTGYVIWYLVYRFIL
jgi:hypothetical protein